MDKSQDFYFFLSKNLKEVKIIIENIIFETNGCGIIFGEKKTGKTAFVKYLSEVNHNRRDFIYIDSEDLDLSQLEDIKNSVIIIDNAHLLNKEQFKILKELCSNNFVIFVVDKEFLVIIKEYLKDTNVKFSLEIKPVSYRELELLFEQYIKSSDKPIQKNKEIIKYLYELTGGKLGEIFENLEKLNELIYYFSLKISYNQKLKYLKLLILFLIVISGYLTFLVFSLNPEKSIEKSPIVEEFKKRVEIFKEKKELPIPEQESVKQAVIRQENQAENTINSEEEKVQVIEQTSEKKDREVKNILKGLVVASTLNVREEPSVDSPVVFKLKRFDEVTVLEQKQGWYRTSNGNVTGWVKSEYIKIAENGYALVKAYALNLREEPSINSNVIIKLKLGDKVKPTGNRKGRWVEVVYKTENGEYTGWVSSYFLMFPENTNIRKEGF